MARLSISRAWDETGAFLKVDRHLMLPLVLALMVLPAVASTMIAPPTMTGGMPVPGPWVFFALLVFLLRILGLLAITRLALGATDSLGATLREVARRMPTVIALILIIFIPVAMIASPLVAAILASPTNPQPGPSVGVLAIIAGMAVMFVYLSFSLAAAVSGSGGPVAIARRSVVLTRGNFWRLAGMILLLLVTFAVLSWVVQMVIGSIVIVTLGRPEPLTVSLLLLVLAIQLVDAAMTVLLIVLLARLYAQLAGGEVSVPSSAA